MVLNFRSFRKQYCSPATSATLVISVVAPPSLRFQGSLLLEVSLFYSIALLYQPLLDRHGTWLIGYRSREAIQFSRNKKEQWYTAPLKRCIIALCNLFRCNIVRWSLKDAVRPSMSFESYIIPQSNICVNNKIQNIVFILVIFFDNRNILCFGFSDIAAALFPLYTPSIKAIRLRYYLLNFWLFLNGFYIKSYIRRT